MRARNLHLSDLKSMNVIRFLVLLIYITAMCLIFGLGVVAGVSEPEETTCQSGIVVCLVFYVGMKILMYLFLVERAHTIRAPRARRLHDWVWVSGILVIAVGFGAVGKYWFQKDFRTPSNPVLYSLALSLSPLSGHTNSLQQNDGEVLADCTQPQLSTPSFFPSTTFKMGLATLGFRRKCLCLSWHMTSLSTLL